MTPEKLAPEKLDIRRGYNSIENDDSIFTWTLKFSKLPKAHEILYLPRLPEKYNLVFFSIKFVLIYYHQTILREKFWV